MKIRAAFLVTALVLVSACNKAPEKTEAAPAEAITTADSKAPAAGGEVSTGVPECDTYLTKAMACVKDKVPEAQRKMMEDGIAQSKAGWASVTDKTQLAATCKAAMDQAKATFGAMGCAF